MKIRWNNILVAVLTAFILIITLRHGASCRAALASLQSLVPNHDVDDRFVGFIVLGILAVTLVAIVKLVTQSRRQDPPDPRDDPPED
jgi:hypothetical protein